MANGSGGGAEEDEVDEEAEAIGFKNDKWYVKRTVATPRRVPHRTRRVLCCAVLCCAVLYCAVAVPLRVQRSPTPNKPHHAAAWPAVCRYGWTIFGGMAYRIVYKDASGAMKFVCKKAAALALAG